MVVNLQAGVLVLGSLFWDNADRERWRRERLNITAARQVWLPIRYGRLSGAQRGHTHTMVLSNLCYAHSKLGVGFVIPCIRSVRTATDLIIEARELAEAEHLGDWTWGAVGLLSNPARKIPPEIFAEWKAFAAQRLHACMLFAHHTKSERPVLSRTGLLQLRWPCLVETSKAVNLDLLLATPTSPTLVQDRYPRPREIGETYARQNRPEYFLENVRHRIRTARDIDIWKSSLRSRPEWAEQYADIGTLLRLKNGPTA